MIVPMMKISLVLLERDTRVALRKLRNEGVLHLESEVRGTGEDLETLLKMRARVVLALGKLDSSVKPKSAGAPDGSSYNRESTLTLVEEIISTEEQIGELHEEIGGITKQISLLEPFGDFEPSDLNSLGASRIEVRLFRGEISLARSLRDGGAVVFHLGKRGKQLDFAAVFFDNVPKMAIERSITLPKHGLSELVSMKDEMTERLGKLRDKLLNLSGIRPIVEQMLSGIEQDIEFESLATGMPVEGGLRWLRGFVPVNRLQSIRVLGSAEGWGILIQEPNLNDQPPTLVENGPKIRIIKPVFDFLETLPGYREYDISAYFLVYFCIFFAMIVGDAGYGVIFLLAALVLRRLKQGPRVIDAVRLLTLLSISTVLWGAITGNWFGSRSLAGLGFFRMLTIPSIAVYPDIFPELEADPQQKIMVLCFLLGLSQLILANIMNFIRDFPKLRSLAQFGWMVFIGGLYFLVLQLVIGVPMPRFAVYMIAGGISLVLFFEKQSDGIGFFRGVLRGLSGTFTTFLSGINGFSNIVSYIRLFAVGMASFYIASSFNNLASPMLRGFLLPVGVVIIAVGHGLNLIMAALSVVVHGIRLNMLEFAGQLGMEWTGIIYSPFRVRISNGNKGAFL